MLGRRMSKEPVEQSHQSLDTLASATREALAARIDLVSRGWQEVRHLAALQLQRSESGSVGQTTWADLVALRPILTSAVVRCSWGESYLQFDASRSVSRDISELLITDVRQPAELQSVFDADQLFTARRAFEGQVEEALSLPGEWSFDLTVDPAYLLNEGDPSHEWIVLDDEAQVIELLTSRPWWELRDVVEFSRPTMIALGGSESGLILSTARMQILPLAALMADQVPIVDGSLFVSPSISTPTPLMPEPTTLYPLKVVARGPLGMEVAEMLRRIAAVAAWAYIASNVTVNPDAIILEYFGLQRQCWSLGPTPPSLGSEACDATLRLWSACVSIENPDRLIASRQVISLYRDPPWEMAADIYKAGEPLYMALRSDATSEALRTQREAYSLALSVARDTADSTSSMARSASERALAALAALAGLLIATTTKTLDVHQSSVLRAVLAAYLLILAAWTFLIEGRPIAESLSSLDNDLQTFSDLLSDEQRSSIIAAKTISRAKEQATIVRIAAPIAYLLIAGVVLWLRL